MNKTRFRLQKYGCFLMCLFLTFTLISPISTSAKESLRKVVRIGLFEDTYNKVNENGEITGYGYEYFQKIASYTGWTYEYVKADWSNCFTKLQNGEIDIINGISYTKERAKNMAFSSMPMGEERYYIYVDVKNTDVSISDLSSFDGKTIGVLKNNMPEVMLNKWEAQNNLHTKHVNISTEEEIFRKLKNNSMDCFVSVEEPWETKNISPILNIGSSDVYFAINKGRSDLKEELDNAMRRITNDNPFYTDDLYREYLLTQSACAVSEEEKKWIKKNGKIRIGYVLKDSGISNTNFESGQVTGVIKDYIDYAQKCLDNQSLEFQLIGFDSLEKQIKALKSGKIDMIFKVPQNLYYTEQNAISLSDTVMNLSFLAVTPKLHFEEEEKNLVAIEKGNLAKQWYIRDSYPNWEIIECPSTEYAEKMVKQGKADCLIVRAGQIRKYIEDNQLHGILLKNRAEISFGVRRENKELLSILNKTLKTMPPNMLTNALSMYENTMQKVTVSDFMNDNLLEVMIFFIVVLVFIFIILELLRKSKIAEAKAKKAMQLAESANAAKTNFLFNMSHDIRTPMNALLGYSLLMKKELNDPKLLHYQEKIDQSGNLLLSIINNVLDMARIESDEVELDENYSKVGAIMGEICAVFEIEGKEKNIHFVREIKVEHNHIMCDITKVQEIFSNLMSNAIKYTPSGGTITLRTEEMPCDKEGFVRMKTDVMDTGIGMSPEFLPHLFDSFTRERNTTTGKVAGTGLGLAIVKKLVDMMDGSIEVESEIGKGSKFTVTLQHRIADEKYYEPKQEKIEIACKDEIQGKHILLAEDNELNAEIAVTILEEMGLIIDHVGDGVECVSKIEQMPAKSYDLILMDIQMPNMDGYAATEKIRQLEDAEKANIPIIAMTANAFEEDKKMALAKGMNGHIAKPIDLQKLEASLLLALHLQK